MRRGVPLVGGLVSAIKRSFGGAHNAPHEPQAAGADASVAPAPTGSAPRAGGAREATSEQILDALRRVVDPNAGRDVVDLGMISGIVVKSGNVGFAIEVSPQDGARKEPLRQACEKAVEAVPGVLSVTAVLTAERGAGAAAPAAPAWPAPPPG